jgi:hypothetical protein
MTSFPQPSSSRPEPRAFARRSGETPVFFSLPQTFLVAVLTLCLAATALAQAVLPKNYQTILDNKDVLVMRVHYGPHEFVPMHDHSAYPTVYVYLNDSGEVRIDHEPPNAFSVTRPPTHTGAFRIAPGMKERHSITNLSDLPSDFFRVELKSIPSDAIQQVFRGEVPSPIIPGIHTEYENPSFRVERLLCAEPTSSCDLRPIDARTLLVPVHHVFLHKLPDGSIANLSNIQWFGGAGSVHIYPGEEFIGIVFLNAKDPD